MVDLNADNILLGVGEVDGQMAQVLGELACVDALDSLGAPTWVAAWGIVNRTSGTLDGNLSRLDGNLDYS